MSVGRRTTSPAWTVSRPRTSTIGHLHGPQGTMFLIPRGGPRPGGTRNTGWDARCAGSTAPETVPRETDRSFGSVRSMPPSSRAYGAGQMDSSGPQVEARPALQPRHRQRSVIASCPRTPVRPPVRQATGLHGRFIKPETDLASSSAGFTGSERSDRSLICSQSFAEEHPYGNVICRTCSVPGYAPDLGPVSRMFPVRAAQTSSDSSPESDRRESAIRRKPTERLRCLL